MSYKIVLDMPNGTKVWINPLQLLKMERTTDGLYFVFLMNGEVYEINRGDARKVEDCFEGRGWTN